MFVEKFPFIIMIGNEGISEGFLGTLSLAKQSARCYFRRRAVIGGEIGGVAALAESPVKVGMRYYFQPRLCMLQWRHSGLVNYLSRNGKTYQPGAAARQRAAFAITANPARNQVFLPSGQAANAYRPGYDRFRFRSAR